MSQRTSPTTNKKYGLKRVCLVWDMPRSTFYTRQARHLCSDQSITATKLRRGPKPEVSDHELLVLIKKDLEDSPFTGEGHRKVWARLKLRLGYKVGRNRVLRLMKEHNLLSPHRVLQGKRSLHEGRITTDAPNVMWGSDAVKVETSEDGWVWVFWAIEHWNAECIGWHVAKRGDRFAALEPIAMGVKNVFGNNDADVARGLHLRTDHGSQYKSEDFTNQIRYWGITPSNGFVREPETNGVVERFNRVFKEQVIHGQVHTTIESLRKAIESFANAYNKDWLLEKLGYKSPLEARMDWNEKAQQAANSLKLAEMERSMATIFLGRPKDETEMVLN